MKIETERLIIRTFEKNDLSEFTNLLDIPEIEGWQMQKPNAEGFLSWHISNYEKMDIKQGIVCFGIFDKQDGCIFGAVGAGEHDDLHETELFYNMLPAKRCNGYATEAAAAVTEWVLKNYDIPYIIGTVSVDNPASQRVLEKCGYAFINEQTLLVHIVNEYYRFRYYRHYR